MATPHFEMDVGQAQCLGGKTMTPSTLMLAGIASGFALGLLVMLAAVVGVHLASAHQGAGRLISVPAKILYWIFLATVVILIVRLLGTTLLIVLVPLAFVTIPMWVPRVAGVGISALTDSFTGGSDAAELRPFYARAVAYRKRGRYSDAATEIEDQLARFPNDATGMMMLAEIRADGFQDLPGALAILNEIIQTPGRADREIALALQQKAAWELDRLKNPEAARASLEQIAENYPDTEAALTARQQLARLPDAHRMMVREEPVRLVVVHHPERLGLVSETPPAVEAPTDPTGEIARLMDQLQNFPDDWTAREQLARLYGGPLGRPDLATAQWEALIQLTTPPPRQTAGWLNELADLQLRSPDGIGAARLTLERISKRFPGTAWAEQAEARMRVIGLDQKAKAAPRTLRLGTYEKNIGLKLGDSSIPDPSKSSV